MKTGRWVCIALILLTMALGVRFGLSAISRKRSIGESISKPEIHSTQLATATPDSGSCYEETLLCQKAKSAFENHEWDEAVACYTTLCRTKPNNGRFAFNRAYSLHAAGKIDEAIVAHRKAAKFPGYKAIATYNLACAFSLKKDRTRALKALQKAVDAGFISKRDPIGNDGNFEYIKNDPVFKKLELLSLPWDRRTIYRQFDFWIGTWDVYNKKGQLIGERTVKKNGQYGGLSLSFSNHRGLKGTGFALVDPEDLKWKQYWSGENGTSLKYVGEFKDGKMQFLGKVFGEGSRVQLQRATFTPLNDGNVKYFIENSKDSGKTWTIEFDGIQRRVLSAQRE